jgi:ABC-type lipoprotein export system ATPase subunit
MTNNSRGSVWRRWDPHIHAPGTVLNDQFTGDSVWEKYLDRIEASDPPIEALGVTDYLSLGTYEQVLAHKMAGRLPDVDLIFANVELRLGVGVGHGTPINAHLLISPDGDDHVERARRFLSSLTFEAHNETFRCDPTDLRRLGRLHNPSTTSDEAALREGTTQFKVSFGELRDEFRKSEWARDNILFAVVAGSRDGTSGLQTADSSFATLRAEIERFAQVIFTGQPRQRDFWLGQGALTPEQIEARWDNLKPCLHGSDAHRLEDVGKPDLDRICWIKGDASFETLLHTCIEPERSIVAAEPPPTALTQRIHSFSVQNTDWMSNPGLPLNPGLVCIIGARGSGKTALADIIAAGASSFAERSSDQSFIRRARDLLREDEVKLTWSDGHVTNAILKKADSTGDAFPAIQYLSQQFVEQLCSSEGITDDLLAEIERVVFEAHPAEQRMGTSSFSDLLEIRARRGRERRLRAEQRLQEAGRRLSQERQLRAALPLLEAERNKKAASIAADREARSKLITRGGEHRAHDLEEVTEAIDHVRSQLDREQLRLQALAGLLDAVTAMRQSDFPGQLDHLKERYADASLTADEWEPFSIRFVGDVDGVLSRRTVEGTNTVRELTGPTVASPAYDETNQPPENSLIPDGVPLREVSFNELRAERRRLEALIGLDRQRAAELRRLDTRISEQETALARLDQHLIAAGSASERIDEIIQIRRVAYQEVFAAIEEEQRQLQSMYSPLEQVLRYEEGALGKLAFSVRRVVDIEDWAGRGEALLDLRKAGKFRGHGALLGAAQASLGEAWLRGSSQEVAEAMNHFRAEHEQGLLAHAPVERTAPENYRRWGEQLTEWLYGTQHVTVSYGVQYDGVEIEQLSPGTRGIVLLLMYLSLDQGDDRPLVIDQPEESLDPKSIFDELVDRFRKTRIRRQVIIVTHNANLVVNTDADQVIVATGGPHRVGRLPEITYMSGGLENPEIRAAVCAILEGGERAFRERIRRLRLRWTTLHPAQAPTAATPAD